MAIDKPHARFEHVYVVLRVDPLPSVKVMEDGVSAVSVYTSKDAAAAEASRLNELKSDSPSYYVVLTSRLKGDVTSDA